MKQDLFFLKALESKGYDINEVLAMTNEELDSLPLSLKIIDSIKDYKLRGAKPVDEIKEQIQEDISIDESSRELTPEVLDTYVKNTEEQEEVLQEVKQIQEEQNAPSEDEVVIERKETSKEDLDIIKEALQSKELKNISAYIKHLKTVVPEAILSSVDSTVISSLVNDRISEVKKGK